MIKYLLMHKNNIGAEVLFDEDKGMLSEVLSVCDEKFLPLCSQNGHANNLKIWWHNRAVPRSRSDIKYLLDKEKVQTTQSLLLNSLGLSMTDAFWVCPAGHQIKWEDVSFQLKMREGKTIDIERSENGSKLFGNLTPMASTGGELKKTWAVINGRIELLKGNISGYYFQQSLNEVLATMIHKKQGYENFVPYRLIRFKDGSVGCSSPCFTDEKTELIPAWEIFYKHDGEPVKGSLLDAYSEYAERDGYDGKKIREHLDYMFTVDFIMSNTDRHSSNYGLLRNSDTLEPLGPAPIFDTGNSMFHLGGGISSFHDLFHITVSSLYDTDGEILDRVKNPSLVSVSKLPSKDEVVALLEKDPVVAPSAERLFSYMDFKVNVVKAKQNGLSMKQIEDKISLYLDDNERKDINKGWNSFWNSMETEKQKKPEFGKGLSNWMKEQAEIQMKMKKDSSHKEKD